MQCGYMHFTASVKFISIIFFMSDEIIETSSVQLISFFVFFMEYDSAEFNSVPLQETQSTFVSK